MDFNICIIGAGVIGLAIAKSLSEKTEGIVVIEKNLRFGEETSSRNSEVIHSGIYYPSRSLKTVLCVKGNQMLYDYCDQKLIPYHKCGKLIVATDTDQFPEIEKLYQQGKANGVKDLQLLSRQEIFETEPGIYAEKALLVPSTGILDSHQLMKNLHGDAVVQGADFVFQSKVTGIRPLRDGYTVQIEAEAGNTDEFSAKWVINCAGLGSEHVAKMVGIHDPAYKLYFCKGEYFRIINSKQHVLRHLVYPVPEPGLAGLGIHTTISLDGIVKLGPNVVDLSENIYDYSVDEAHKKQFFEAASRYLPDLKEDQLVPEMAGIRPKLQTENGAFRDFVIQHEIERGFPGFIHLTGINSPGLTSCLSIAACVSEIFEKND